MNKNVIIGVLGFFLIIVGAVYLNKASFGNVDPNPTVASSAPSKYDNFAKCLTEKGAKMYGAFTCIYCKNQKAAFGSSFQYVNYQECTVDGKAGTFAQVCNDAGIKGYPTWKFSDGTVKEGEVPMSQLAEKTGCVLPQ
ncbi:MAG: hypothetical protein Q8N37_02445 [bacterium]|nr:hypothetical protein [bacterium]